MPKEQVEKVIPGQPVFADARNQDWVGFVYKVEPTIMPNIEVVLCEPIEWPEQPNQKWLSAEFPNIIEVFGELLEKAPEGLKQWWREAIPKMEQQEKMKAAQKSLKEAQEAELRSRPAHGMGPKHGQPLE